MLCKKMANLSSLLMVIFADLFRLSHYCPLHFLVATIIHATVQKKQAEETPAVKSPEPSEEVKLLREIRDTLQKSKLPNTCRIS